MEIGKRIIMEYQIWMEGYAATGEHGTAKLLSTKEANSFDEAVEKYVNEDMQGDRDMKLYSKGERYLPRNASGIMEIVADHSIWGCRLFDNETDARKTFG